MATKTTLLLRNCVLMLMYVCCWLLLFLNIWQWRSFVFAYMVLTVIFYFVFRHRNDKFGRVRLFILWLLLALLFASGTFLVESNEIATRNFQVLPILSKLAHIMLFLIGVVVLLSKVYEDGKFSEKKEEA